MNIDDKFPKIGNPLPGIEFHTREAIADYVSLGDKAGAVQRAIYTSATRLAHMIIERPEFFRVEIESPFTLLKVESDCYVLTRAELQRELEKHFEMGFKHGQRFGYLSTTKGEKK